LILQEWSLATFASSVFLYFQVQLTELIGQRLAGVFLDKSRPSDARLLGGAADQDAVAAAGRRFRPLAGHSRSGRRFPTSDLQGLLLDAQFALSGLQPVPGIR
jgi:hypothetical protein